MKLSENPINLEQLDFTEVKTYTFKYGEYSLPGTIEKAPYRVNIVFKDKKFIKLEFLDTQEQINLNNLPVEKILIMDAVADKIKELESLV